MLDAAPTKIKTENDYRPIKANDCVPDPANYRPPEKLFDEFWREGELSLLFGPAGTGKTVLAVQIAEALARGRSIEGFTMPTKRRRVLYVDLVHSGDQFHARRSDDTGRFYKFSDNLHRRCPDDPDKLIEWLRELISELRYSVVVIDDLTALRTASDGSREALKLMRDLRRLKNELGISILVVSPSREPRAGQRIGDSCLMRSRVLCEVADSVFAIGRHERQPEWVYLMQIRSRGSAIHWNRDNAPHARIRRGDDALLAMHFDERFEPKIDSETRHRIIELKALREKHTIREIAEMTGLGRSRVERLLKKWRPSMQEETESLIEQYEDAIDDPTDDWIDDPTADSTGGQASLLAADPDQTVQAFEGAFRETGEFYDAAADLLKNEVTPHPPPDAVLTMTQDEIFEACGCWRGKDVNGDFVWIEEADGRGKPIIMYQPARIGYNRWKYTTTGKMGIDKIHGPVCIRNDFS